jgi:4-carboxymuconolactone decarboxylase
MRYSPLKPEEMTPRQREVAEAIEKRRVGGLGGPYAPLIYSPEVADRAQQLSEYLRFGLRTPERLRLLAVLQTARYYSSGAEFLAATKDAREAGLADEKIKALSEGRRPADMTADEAMIYDFCAQIHTTGRVKNVTFNRVESRFNREVCLELVIVCGYTAFSAMVHNVTQTPLPKDETKPLNPPTLR